MNGKDITQFINNFGIRNMDFEAIMYEIEIFESFYKEINVMTNDVYHAMNTAGSVNSQNEEPFIEDIDVEFPQHDYTESFPSLDISVVTEASDNALKLTVLYKHTGSTEYMEEISSGQGLRSLVDTANSVYSDLLKENKLEKIILGLTIKDFEDLEFLGILKSNAESYNIYEAENGGVVKKLPAFPDINELPSVKYFSFNENPSSNKKLNQLGNIGLPVNLSISYSDIPKDERKNVDNYLTGTPSHSLEPTGGNAEDCYISSKANKND